MSSTLLFSLVIAYFLLLLVVAWFTSRNANNDSFFIGNRGSNWLLVAFGMIGTSLSGVTFVSVPGTVAAESFSYFQVIIGNVIGYAVVAFVLLPVYYKMKLTSIYNYLKTRLGVSSYKAGAAFFILSRILGATARLYLVINVLHSTVLKDHMPFWVAALIVLVMILLYTFEGGVKTIVWTDTLQTACMLIGLVVCVIYILNDLDLSLVEGTKALAEKGYSSIFVTDPNSKFFFLKQILAGAFISITMTGMDQEMMQKNISVKTLGDSQKNMMTFAFIFMGVVLLFLFLGGVLYLYAEAHGIQTRPDLLFSTIALGHLPAFMSIIFVIALISALFPSADGAITALTSSFCIDILGIQRDERLDDKQRKKVRQVVHLSFAVLFLLFVMIFKWMDNSSMIGLILKIAGYTYGPLLGLFAFGILTKKQVNDKWVPVVMLIAPAICFFIDKYQKQLFGNFEIGLELLFINGLLTFIGLLLIPRKEEDVTFIKAN